MSGILNTKQRIMDTILTQEGKRQLASGELRLNFITFTDNATFYKKDLVSGSADATERIYLESCNLPQDQITFESHDTGGLKSFIGTDEFGYKVLNGKLISGSTYVTSSIANVSKKLLDTSFVAFQRLQSIGTTDSFFEDNSFEISDNNINFDITNESPFSSKDIKSLVVENTEEFLSDSRFSRTKHFKYLPPINKQTNYQSQQNQNVDTSDIIGIYPKFKSENEQTNIDKILKKIYNSEKKGHKKTITFLESSRNNNIFCQFFEAGNASINKLEIIDFGVINNKRYFFAGKVFVDNNQISKFINLFTLVFEH
jgi:hypothetical protein